GNRSGSGDQRSDAPVRLTTASAATAQTDVPTSHQSFDVKVRGRYRVARCARDAVMTAAASVTAPVMPSASAIPRLVATSDTNAPPRDTSDATPSHAAPRSDALAPKRTNPPAS